MALPRPEPGLVLSYGYLWRREAASGITEGRKTRPVVVVLALETEAGKPPRVTVAPVTHARPDNPAVAIELPPKVKAALGLDHAPSWIMADEVNQFDWPGFDLRPIPGRRGAFAYGFLPPRLYSALIERVRALAVERRLRLTAR
jgi:hypothetical protein